MPKKKVSKYIINPEYVQKQRKIAKIDLQENIYGDLAHWDYEEVFPQEDVNDKDDSDVIKESWLLVVKTPPCGIVIPPMTIIYGRMVDGETKFRKMFPVKLWEVNTPFGPLRLKHHEVRLIDVSDYSYAFGKDFTMKKISDSHASKKLKDMIFYLRQRGISEGKAIQMLLDTDMKKFIDYVYFVAHTAYQEYFCTIDRYINDDIIKIG